MPQAIRERLAPASLLHSPQRIKEPWSGFVH